MVGVKEGILVGDKVVEEGEDDGELVGDRVGEEDD